MNISDSFREIDKVGFTKYSQPSVDSIEEIVSRDVVGELHPLHFEHSPESLCDIKMRSIKGH